MLSQADYQEVFQMRREFKALRAEFECTKREYYAHKFDPNQPRKPPGPGGGQWTSDGGGAASDQRSTDAIPVAGKQSAAFCWNQMLIDMIYCGSFERTWYRAACRA